MLSHNTHMNTTHQKENMRIVNIFQEFFTIINLFVITYIPGTSNTRICLLFFRKKRQFVEKKNNVWPKSVIRCLLFVSLKPQKENEFKMKIRWKVPLSFCDLFIQTKEWIIDCWLEFQAQRPCNISVIQECKQ